MNKIDGILGPVNPYIQSFKSMREVEKEVEREAEQKGIEPPQLRLLFDVNAKNVDRRRYNVPCSTEVAAVFVLDGEDMPVAEGLAIHQRGRQLQKISKFEKRAESMLYPLYFPSGKGGCSANMRTINNKKVTFAQYYRHMISIRRPSVLVENEDESLNFLSELEWEENSSIIDDFSPIRMGGKLYQQSLVDAYVKIEQDRLDFIRKNQKAIKAENYKALQDYLQDTADEQGKRVGKVIVLPSSFKGSPRSCMQGYQDSMAIVRRFGKPDLFITFTCNPKWEDIKRNLQPGNTVLDEPDLVSRVFNLKLKELLEDLKKNDYFGKVIAYTYVVEFQKRGLPHAHILIVLDNNSKIRSAEQVDKIVWAEIPNEREYPRLHEIVVNNMLHGPCGDHNPRCACMSEDREGRKFCSKKFPKAFRDTTVLGTNSYAEYRRRDNKVHIVKKVYGEEVIVDNRWVVPYNPVLSLKYHAHVNVEICASIKSIKYLYKYVYKGHDCAKMVISVKDSNQVEHDEINTYLNMRYVTPHEAFWRIFEFTLDEKSHAVTRLDVHLPNEQLVYYKPENDNIRQRLSDAELRNTTLTAWFELNARVPEARTLYYYEIPEKYTYKKGANGMIWDRKGGITGMNCFT
ncbi:hypothetical protein WR25_06991 [Diploscapter pachys]|uniref:Helitron helicase-like domain-containing protein n=1 Tax=Diploscapter pachys TaxID=2018661 RepID=A0A2A2JW11_9BILA|nr:hypothetical protein WR25_06991 [Diploscapter pachys]